MNKKRKSVQNAVFGAIFLLMGLYLFHTAMTLEATGGFLYGNSVKSSWMAPWQCYLAGGLLVLLGVILFFDSIRSVSPKVNPSEPSQK